MKKLLSSLALATLVTSSAGPLASGVIGANINKNPIKTKDPQGNIIITTALQLLVQVMVTVPINGSSMTTSDTQQDSFSIIWETISTKCLKPAADLARKVPLIGVKVAVVIESITQSNIQLTNPGTLLVAGNNVINIVINLGDDAGSQSRTNMNMFDVQNDEKVVAFKAVQTLSNVMVKKQVIASSLTTANTQQDSFSLIWNTVKTQCIAEAQANARTIPKIGDEVAALIATVSQTSIQITNPDTLLVAGTNKIELILDINNTETSLDMTLTNVMNHTTVIATKSVEILSQVMSSKETVATTLTTANTQQDSFSLIWNTVKTKCIAEAVSIAKSIPTIGQEVVTMINSVTENNITITNSSTLLVAGNNQIELTLSIGGTVGFSTILNMNLTGVRVDTKVIEKAAVGILSKKMINEITNASSLTTANTQQDSFSLIWNTVRTKSIVEAKAEAWKNPTIGKEVVAMLGTVSQSNIQLINPDKLLVTGTNEINLKLSIGGSEAVLNMNLTGVKNQITVVATKAVEILSQVMMNTKINGASLTTGNIQLDSFPLMWNTVTSKCIAQAVYIAKQVPNIGEQVASMISGVSQSNIKITNAGSTLVAGTNIIALQLSLGGVAGASIKFNMTVTNVVKESTVIVKKATDILAQVMSTTQTDGSSLTTANTQANSLSLIWTTITTKCISEAISIAKSLPVIGQDVALMINTLSKCDIELATPGKLLVAGRNIINLNIKIGVSIVSKISLNMTLNGVVKL